MRPSRTVVVALVAFGLGVVVSGMVPPAAALQPQPAPFVSATPDAEGVTFRNLTNSRVLILAISDVKSSHPGEFTRGTGEARLPANDSTQLLFLEVGRSAILQDGKMTDCTLAECLGPQPCPPAGSCPPWFVLRTIEVWPK